MAEAAKVFSNPDISGLVILFKGKECSEFHSIVAQNITAGQMSVLARYFDVQAELMVMAEEQRKLQAIAEEKARKERERLLKQAEKLKTPELKEQRIQEAEMVEAPVVVLQKETPTIKGISIKKTWKALVVNKHDFLKYAIETKNETAMSFVELSQSKLDAFARATQGEVSFAGIEFYQESNMSSGGK